MHCNLPFYGNGFSNGQCYGYNPFNIPPQNNCLSPGIVGEGEVKSVILPDGTFQYFFIPTTPWWAPYTVNNSAYYKTNPLCGSVGAWFIRTITNPTQVCDNFRPSPRCVETNSDPNVNMEYPGYQLKFHNDRITSTTDLHYFIPCTRQIDCTYKLPAKGCAAVQVDTPETYNTICYYQICPKPCNCPSKTNQVNVVPNYPSLSINSSKLHDSTCPCCKPTSTNQVMGKNVISNPPVCTCCPPSTECLIKSTSPMSLDSNKSELKNKVCLRAMPMPVVKKLSKTTSIPTKRSLDSELCKCCLPSAEKLAKTTNTSVNDDKVVSCCDCDTQTSKKVLSINKKDISCEQIPPPCIDESISTMSSKGCGCV